MLGQSVFDKFVEDYGEVDGGVEHADADEDVADLVPLLR